MVATKVVRIPGSRLRRHEHHWQWVCTCGTKCYGYRRGYVQRFAAAHEIEGHEPVVLR